MTEENLNKFTINYLSEEQYTAALAAGTLNDNDFYCTSDDLYNNAENTGGAGAGAVILYASDDAQTKYDKILSAIEVTSDNENKDIVTLIKPLYYEVIKDTSSNMKHYFHCLATAGLGSLAQGYYCLHFHYEDGDQEGFLFVIATNVEGTPSVEEADPPTYKNKIEVHNVLDSTSETDALSANQGKILNEKIINKVDKVDGKGLSTCDFTTDLKTKLDNIEEQAQNNIIETIQVNSTNLAVEDKTVNIVIPEESEYNLIETSTTSGYSKTYSLTKNNVEIGTKINIPKDLVVSSGSIKEVTVINEPYTNAIIGDKYIDLVLNDSEANHIYIPVKDLVDVYTSGNGINVATNNEINLIINSSLANGLSVTTNGLQLAIATTSSAGAMSTADKTKLNGIATGANKTVINNTITSTSTTEALSANMGKTLADRIAALEARIAALESGEINVAINPTDTSDMNLWITTS